MEAPISHVHQMRIERRDEHAVDSRAGPRCQDAGDRASHHRRLTGGVHPWNAVQQISHGRLELPPARRGPGPLHLAELSWSWFDCVPVRPGAATPARLNSVPTDRLTANLLPRTFPTARLVEPTTSGRAAAPPRGKYRSGQSESLIFGMRDAPARTCRSASRTAAGNTGGTSPSSQAR